MSFWPPPLLCKRSISRGTKPLPVWILQCVSIWALLMNEMLLLLSLSFGRFFSNRTVSTIALYGLICVGNSCAAICYIRWLDIDAAHHYLPPYDRRSSLSPSDSLSLFFFLVVPLLIFPGLITGDERETDLLPSDACRNTNTLGAACLFIQILFWGGGRRHRDRPYRTVCTYRRPAHACCQIHSRRDETQILTSIAKP